MALYDKFITQLQIDVADVHSQKAARIILHLQSVIRDYNSDDAIFDDEKTLDESDDTFESALESMVIAEVVVNAVPEILEVAVDLAEGAVEIASDIIEGVGDFFSNLFD